METEESSAEATHDELLTARLAEASSAGRHGEVIALIEGEIDRVEQDPAPHVALLREMQMSAARAGAATLHLRALRRRVEHAPTDQNLRRYLRAAEGRWRESEPGWLPTIAPEVLAALPASRDRSLVAQTKVLHLLKIGMPQRQSGYSMRSMYTLTGQVRAGLDVVAVTALDFPLSIGAEDAPEEEMVNGVRYRHLLREEIPVKEPFDTYLNAYATALAPVVAQEAPDVIHVHSGHRGTEAALVALAVGQALDIPVVYEVRGFFEALWTRETAWAESAEIYDRRRAAETHCLGAADAVVTLSESMKADIVARGVPADHVHVVPNGVDPGAFTPEDRDLALTDRLGLRDAFVFGYISNLDHYREAQEILVDAAVELRRRGVPAVALVVGDGKRRDVVEEHIRETGAQEAVRLTGKVPHDEVVDYYAQLDVFVIPRIDERAARLVTPLKPFEAMALGVPLVVSNLPALREIVGDGARGEIFTTGDAMALADVLERLSSSPARREELASLGRDWVLSHRTWAHNDERYAGIYASVLSRSSAS